MEIGALGAEMISLKDADGRDLLWNGDAAFWTGRAPLLFPIVGRLTNDTLIHDGVAYPMTQHGFARRRPFELMSASDSRATFRLVDDDETRKQYPFAFGLYITYTLNEATLTIEARVHNPGVSRIAGELRLPSRLPLAAALWRRACRPRHHLREGRGGADPSPGGRAALRRHRTEPGGRRLHQARARSTSSATR